MIKLDKTFEFQSFTVFSLSTGPMLIFVCKVHNLCYPVTNLVYYFPIALKSVISTFSEKSHIRNLLLLLIIIIKRSLRLLDSL